MIAAVKIVVNSSNRSDLGTWYWYNLVDKLDK